MPKNPSRSKFSSWNTEEPKVNGHKNGAVSKAQENDNNFMDEVDELLLEQDLLSPTSAEAAMSSITKKNSDSKRP